MRLRFQAKFRDDLSDQSSLLRECSNTGDHASCIKTFNLNNEKGHWQWATNRQCNVEFTPNAHYLLIFLTPLLWKRKFESLSCVRLFAIPWTVVCQAPLPMEFSRQEYWGGLPFPPPGDLTNPGIKPVSPALASGFFTIVPTGKPALSMLELISHLTFACSVHCN